MKLAMFDKIMAVGLVLVVSGMTLNAERPQDVGLIPLTGSCEGPAYFSLDY